MMATFPLDLIPLLGKFWAFVVYGVIGFGFGYALEVSGFGNSKKLAAQFYFKDLTVLKVMFTAIVVAMVLIFAASSLGLLDYNLIYVNTTYLWPGIVGGLIMGVGFIIGGFCPGTSLVAMVTKKIDGLFFVLGGLFGIFVFGEVVDYFATFWNSSNYGRVTLMDVFNLPTGVVVVLVVLMALFMFWGGEQLERIFGKRDLKKEPRRRYAAAAALLVGALAVMFIGQPTTEDRWARIAPVEEPKLVERAVQIHPGELLAAIYDPALRTVILDVRSEADYNLFHIVDARRVTPEMLSGLVAELRMAPNNTVVVVMSNDEVAATQLWRDLTAQSVANVYILEGGINEWLATFARGDARIVAVADQGVDKLDYSFTAALGDNFPASDPSPHEFELEYIPKIKLEIPRGPKSGGCG
jgi:rhodanese-related sulfurtransferase